MRDEIVTRLQWDCQGLSKIEAIKLIRERLGCSITTGKHLVEDWERDGDWKSPNTMSRKCPYCAVTHNCTGA